jgi:UDP-N-acetylmuramoylalanine--D-glutamate ligase
LPISYTLGEHREQDFAWADIIVRNQAVPRESEWLALARRLGKQVVMEVGLFFQLCPATNIIGITGTKGKTTTTTLCYEMVKAWRSDAVVAGNISGKPPLDVLPQIKVDTPVVLELSSWQLEGTDELGVSPHIGCWLNLSPDHLNRYRDMEDYAEAKWLIFKHQQRGDIAIMNFDDPIVRRYADQLPAGVSLQWFGERIPDGAEGGYIKGEWLMLRCDNVETQIARLSDLKLPGRHNAMNALAAALCANAAGAPKAAIAMALANFSGIRDRFELLAEIDGIKFYNDTTSTTPASTIAALAALPNPVRLLAGGSDKRMEYNELAKVIAKRYPAVRVYLLEGSATDKLEAALRDEGVRPQGRFDNFEAAVNAAYADAGEEDVVLLSPAAASFGMFVNEFERGDKFREIVAGLQSKVES